VVCEFLEFYQVTVVVTAKIRDAGDKAEENLGGSGGLASKVIPVFWSPTFTREQWKVLYKVDCSLGVLGWVLWGSWVEPSPEFWPCTPLQVSSTSAASATVPPCKQLLYRNHHCLHHPLLHHIKTLPPPTPKSWPCGPLGGASITEAAVPLQDLENQLEAADRICFAEVLDAGATVVHLAVDASSKGEHSYALRCSYWDSDAGRPRSHLLSAFVLVRETAEDFCSEIKEMLVRAAIPLRKVFFVMGDLANVNVGEQGGIAAMLTPAVG